MLRRHRSGDLGWSAPVDPEAAQPTSRTGRVEVEHPSSLEGSKRSRLAALAPALLAALTLAGCGGQADSRTVVETVTVTAPTVAEYVGQAGPLVEAIAPAASAITEGSASGLPERAELAASELSSIRARLDRLDPPSSLAQPHEGLLLGLVNATRGLELIEGGDTDRGLAQVSAALGTIELQAETINAAE